MLKTCRLYPALLAIRLALPPLSGAVPVDISTPGGVITIDLSHAGPTGQLVEPDPPSDAGFRPPTVFAAPLPVGSGARALGQAGAFTAVADDATAASWNPAGLTQLERPEVSAVYRSSAREDQHESNSSALEVGQNNYRSSELNYLSAVYPFLFDGLNVVGSINYQESYDFTHEFSARFSGTAGNTDMEQFSETFQEFKTNEQHLVNQRSTFVYDITTVVQGQIDQVLNSSLLTGIDFRQSGTIDAISPAFAIDLSPKLSFGMALNFYTDGAARGNPIESTLIADYNGMSDSVADIRETRDSTAVVSWTGEQYLGRESNPISHFFSGSTNLMYSDTETTTREDEYLVEGIYREENRTEDFHGINATLGLLWAIDEKLSLGATVDLPWTGQGKQTKQIKHQVTTFDSGGVEVADSNLVETRTSDVQYTFPLYWSVGALWRWSDRLYSSVDASRTHWSQFSYQAGDGEKINPLNGEPHNSSASDDCWSLRLGGEYLCMLSWTEIPLRGGLFWEERPAAGSPDQYWGFSFGSGISLGKDPGKLVLDLAYIYEQGNNVMNTLLPDHTTRSDSTKHQLFISCVWHF